MTQIVHEVTCAWPPCEERVGTSESFNALAFLLSDLGWAEVREEGAAPTAPSSWFCPMHLPVEKDPKAAYLAYCINCGFDWDAEFTEDEFPYIRSEHSRRCFNDSHPECSASDVKFRPNTPYKPTTEQQESWARAQLASDAYEAYVAFLIERDQQERVEAEIWSSRSWIVRFLLTLADRYR